MTTFSLQLIAVVSMLIDHLAYAFFENDFLLRSIGRFAFVAYAFLIAVAFTHIKNNHSKVKSHLIFYIVLALLSEISYDYFLQTKIDNIRYSQNAVWTLLIGFLGLLSIHFIKGRIIHLIVICISIYASAIIQSDYKVSGVFLIFAFYFYLQHYKKANIFYKILMLYAIIAIYILLYQWAIFDYCGINELALTFLAWNTTFYPFYLFTPLLLILYNGTLGYTNKYFKLFYRLFYPLHLAIIGAILSAMQ